MQVIFYILLLTIILYIFWSNIENFEATGPTDAIKEAVKLVYLADVESIRNLSAVAKKLHEDGALVTPTNMSIRGKLNINSPANAKDLPANVTLSVDNATETTIRLKTKADDAKNITLTNNDGNLTMGNAKGADLLNIKADGNVAIKNGLTTSGDIIGKNIRADNNLAVIGNLSTNTLTAGSNITAPKITTPNIISDVGTINTLNTKLLNGHDIRNFIPIVVNLCWEPPGNNSLGNRTFVFPNETCMFYTWNNDSNVDRAMDLSRKSISKKLKERQGRSRYNPSNADRYAYLNVRNLTENITACKMVILSIPPGKMVKLYGFNGEFQKYSAGYHEDMVSFGIHGIWAGWEEFEKDMNDGINIRTGVGFE